MKKNSEQYLILNAVPGMGPVTLRRLVELLGEPERWTSADLERTVRERIISPSLRREIITFDRAQFLRREQALMAQHNVHAVTWADAFYPSWLKAIHDPPPVLYCRGRTEALMSAPGLGIVGSRKSSVYGLTTAGQLSARLAERGVAVISGLARGIDTAAHRGCLRAGGITVAVLGCGLSRIYPPENAVLADEIAAKDGLVVSEFPMTAPPAAMHFPRRNRIISGLGRGVLVIEASAKSGALITAEFALEQGRDVFALPGRIDCPSAAGSNKLIQQGAKMVTSLEDILEEWDLADACPRPDERVSAVPRELTEPEVQLLENIDRRPVAADALALTTAAPVQNILNILLQLELKHFIKQLPGKRFVRV